MAFERHPVSVCKQRGLVYIDRENNKITRTMTPHNAKVLNSEMFKNKQGILWPSVEKTKAEKQYNVEYIYHPIYFAEMTNKQLGDCFEFWCNLLKYICKNSDQTLMSHQWNVVASAGQYYLIDIGDFVPQSGTRNFTRDSIITWWQRHATPRLPHTWLNNDQEVRNAALEVGVNGDGLDELIEICRDNIKKDVSNKWDRYTGAFNSIDEMINKSQNLKDKTVHDWVKEVMPETLTDLGCNSGKQALMAANLGIRSVGIDYAAGSINIATKNAEKMNLKCSFAYIDLLNPSILQSHKVKQLYELPNVRLKSEMAVASALLHHLYLACRDIDRVIDTIVSYSTKHVAMEMIPKHDKHMAKRHKGNWFTRDSIEKRLNFHGYKIVKETDSTPKPRTWIFASKI